MQHITGILITGGQSSRMKEDKALKAYNSKKMGEWTSDLLHAFCDIVLVASNHPSHIIFGDQIIGDSIGEGPIAGLYAGLQESKTQWNLILPCDTPHITTDVIKQLWKTRDGYDAVVAVDSQGKIHPLIGFYNKSILPLVSIEIQNKQFSIMNILDRIKTKQVTFNSDITFKNINTIEDIT